MRGFGPQHSERINGTDGTDGQVHQCKQSSALGVINNLQLSHLDDDRRG